MAKNLLRRKFSNMYGTNKPYQNSEPLPVVKDKVPQIEDSTITVSTILLYTIVLFFFVFLYFNRDRIYVFFEQIYKDFKPGKQVDELEEKYNNLFKHYNEASTQDASMNRKKINEVLEQGQQRMDSLETREKKLIELLEKNQKTFEQHQKSFESIEKTKKAVEALERSHQKMESSDLIQKKIDSLEQREREKRELETKEEQGAVKKLTEKISGYTKEQTVTSNGFCYIGYDNNQRDCTTVSDGDICMSGQVFPSMDICLYPKFRQ